MRSITRDGWLVGGLGLALLAVAVISGNNLLYLVASAVGVAWIGGIALGRWNLRGVTVARVLPAEIHADLEAPGRLVVRNDRRWLPAVGIELRDDAGAVGFAAFVPTGGEVAAPVVWCFPRRGVTNLARIELRSTFPFGLVTCARSIVRPAEIVVYPHPRGGRAALADGDDPGDAGPSRLRGRDGDFVGVRAYVPGDRPSAIHWRSTARVGELVVVQGSGEVEPHVDVVVHDRPDRERELARATGEILDGFARGLRVGLVLPGFDGEPPRRFPPQAGSAWRRTLLEALARVGEAP